MLDEATGESATKEEEIAKMQERRAREKEKQKEEKRPKPFR